MRIYQLLSITACLICTLTSTSAMAIDFVSNITPTHSSDAFQFNLANDSEVTLISSLNGTLNGGNSGFGITSADGSAEIVRSSWAHPGDIEGPWALKAGTYVLKIWNNASNSGSYKTTIDIKAASLANDNEPNDDIQSALPVVIEQEFTGHLGYYGGVRLDHDWTDYYQVTTLEAGMLKILTDTEKTLSSSGAFGAYLYLADGDTLIRDPDTMLPAGKYYLRIWVNNAWAYGGYSARLIFTPTAKTNATLEFSSKNLAFGHQEVGSVASQSITLNNVGTSAANISGINLNGDFRVQNLCPTLLQPRQSCQLNVGFTPSTTGEHLGTLRVNFDATHAEVALSGTGFVTLQAKPWSISATNLGSGASQVNLQLIFAPPVDERNGSYNLYIAGWYQGQLFFATLNNGNLVIVPYLGGEFPVYAIANGTDLYQPDTANSFNAQTWSIRLGDLSPFHGLNIYAGFGRSASDMLNKGQFKNIFSIE